MFQGLEVVHLCINKRRPVCSQVFPGCSFMSLTVFRCVSLSWGMSKMVVLVLCSQLAVCMGTPILTPAWILKAWERRNDA